MASGIYSQSRKRSNTTSTSESCRSKKHRQNTSADFVQDDRQSKMSIHVGGPGTDYYRPGFYDSEAVEDPCVGNTIIPPYDGPHTSSLASSFQTGYKLYSHDSEDAHKGILKCRSLKHSATEDRRFIEGPYNEQKMFGSEASASQHNHYCGATETVRDPARVGNRTLPFGSNPLASSGYELCNHGSEDVRKISRERKSFKRTVTENLERRCNKRKKSEHTRSGVSASQHDVTPYSASDRKSQWLFLKKLSRMSTTTILSRFTVKRFADILGSLEPSSTDLALLLVEVLSRMSMSPLSHSEKEIINNYHLQLFQSEHISAFFQCISAHVCAMPQEGKQKKRIDFVRVLGDVVSLFGELLSTQPYNASTTLPIDACCGTVEQLCCQDFLFKEMEEKVLHLRSQRNKFRQDLFQASYFKQTHVEDSQLPTLEDLHSTMVPVTLKANITEEPFPSVAEYLSIFIGLLREDFIHPLRETLYEIRNGYGLLYKDVHLKCCLSIKSKVDDVLCKLSFQPVGRSINWERTKRFMYGNLLCLSEDDFTTVIFAIIAERDIDDLQEHTLIVKLIGQAAQDASYTSSLKVYKMFESPSYYEAYAPVIMRLEKLALEPAQLPFQDYLIGTKKVIEQPVYFKQQPNIQLSLHGIVCSCHHATCKHSNIDINTIEQQQLESSGCLDQSQLSALCTALTKELVLIQGPPGTGKTYIGLKIVQSLLNNKSVWAPNEQVPIMIVCFTNHALDQFLEGLIQIKESAPPNSPIHSLQVRRVGGRSKSEVLAPCNISKFVGMACRHQGLKLKSQKKLVTLRNRIDALENFLAGKLNPTKRTTEMCSYFLSKAILTEMSVLCNIRTQIPDTIKKQLVTVKANENSFHSRLEAERRIEDESKTFHELYTVDSLHQVTSHFSTVGELSERRAKEHFKIRDYSKIEPFIQLQLFRYCLLKLQDAWRSEAECLAQLGDKHAKVIEFLRIKCLQEADVIGLTTTGAAKYSSALLQVKAKICVIEEAAEVLEPHIISTLTPHTQHLILIGDHKQLRPRLNSYEIGTKYKLEISLFERLANNNFPVVTLDVQHRMRPEISRFVSKHIYEDKLKNSLSVDGYDNVQGMKSNVFFIDHTELETKDEENTSPSNEHEANFVVALANYLLKNGHKPEEITIITPYLGQMFLIQRLPLNPKVYVRTIDNYQGEENEIILLSMVRSNDKNIAGFTKENNRVCVALSRAKIGFYCIGNFSMFRKCSKLWSSILRDLGKQSNRQFFGTKLPLQCQVHATVTEVSCAQDFLKIPSGGCEQECGRRFPLCNHVCNRKCHPEDLDHNFTCTYPCPKRCSKDHKCQGICGSPCPPCMELVETTLLNCGHSQEVPCSLSPTEFLCKVACVKILTCGHPCKLTCGEKCDSKPCRMLVTKVWPCGHEAQKECSCTEIKYSFSCSFSCEATLACTHLCSGKCWKCYQGRLHVPCKQVCGRTLVCGHVCPEPCATNCPPCEQECQFKCPHGKCGHRCSEPCKPCPHPCDWRCKHYKCTRNCGEICNRPRCLEPCKKKLKCGHLCIGVCGEPCPIVCRICHKDWEVFDIFFGSENEPDSRFVKLDDCQHVFEMNSLDKWVDQDSSTIAFKRCPKCKEPIVSTLRYANRAKQILQDINAVKEKTRKVFVLSINRQDYTEKSCKLTEEMGEMLHCVSPSLNRSVNSWLRKVKQTLNAGSLSDSKLENLLAILQWLSQMANISAELSRYINEDDNSALNNKAKVLLSQMDQALEWTVSHLKNLSFTKQTQGDFLSESRRLVLLGELYLCLYRSAPTSLSPGDQAKIQDYECLCNKPKTLPEDFFEDAMQKISPLTAAEKKMIVKAVGAKPGSWYKCPNGHIYQIGECGGAMETSKCPDCSAVIGGGRHTLVHGNWHAGEFDGSRCAAWS